MIEAVLGVPLGFVMRVCYDWVKNYGLAIVLFTMITKLIILPIGLWVHKNGIKIVKMSPELNRIKIKHFGDKDAIADEQAKLYKREKYNPLLSLLPLFVQIALLMGLVYVIYHPMTYILGLTQDAIEAVVNLNCQLTGADALSSSVQLTAVRAVQSPEWINAFDALGVPYALAAIRELQFVFFGIDISLVPIQAGGVLWLMPIMAAFSAWLLCYCQNRDNVLQSEQGNFNKYGTMVLSVGLSLYLGTFVPAGVAVYWIVGNLLAILQTLALNRIIDPKKHVDYQALEESKQALKNLTQMDAGKLTKEQKKREKADYKRFFSIANKHLVFYAESNGFYKYFQKTIEYLLANSKVIIHYITNDPKDAIFARAEVNPQIKPYYISKNRTITLLMKLEADMLVSTTPDLDNYYFKRSYYQKDIEYVYVPHHPSSTHMVFAANALDHFDTVLCSGNYQIMEIRARETYAKLPPKTLLATGYGQLDMMHEKFIAMPMVKRDRKKALIAPSWQADNILDSCIDELLAQILNKGYDVVVRPHPEYIKRYPTKMDALLARYGNDSYPDLSFELDFTSNDSLFDSDIVISDWSGAAYEFAFVTLKPVLFIDTAPKIYNPDYQLLGIEPLEFVWRDQVGLRVAPDKLDTLMKNVDALLNGNDSYREVILQYRERYFEHFGRSGEATGEYILASLRQKVTDRKA